MTHLKKMVNTMDIHSQNTHAMPDKANHSDQRITMTETDKYNRSIAEETVHVEKHKRKTAKQDSKDHTHKETRRGTSDIEFPPVTGVTFPSVKGAEGL